MGFLLSWSGFTPGPHNFVCVSGLSFLGVCFVSHHAVGALGSMILDLCLICPFSLHADCKNGKRLLRWIPGHIPTFADGNMVWKLSCGLGANSDVRNSAKTLGQHGKLVAECEDQNLICFIFAVFSTSARALTPSNTRCQWPQNLNKHNSVSLRGTNPKHPHPVPSFQSSLDLCGGLQDTKVLKICTSVAGNWVQPTRPKVWPWTIGLVA